MNFDIHNISSYLWIFKNEYFWKFLLLTKHIRGRIKLFLYLQEAWKYLRSLFTHFIQIEQATSIAGKLVGICILYDGLMYILL